MNKLILDLGDGLKGIPDQVIYNLILVALADGIELQQEIVNNEFMSHDDKDDAREIINKNRLLIDNLTLGK